MEQGRAHYTAENFAAAAETWREAAEQFKQQNELANQALALSYLTAAYQQLGHWQQAEQSITESKEILSTLSTDQPGLSLIAAQIINTEGSLQFARGRIENALQTWQQAADLYAQNGEEQRYFNNLLNQVQAQQTLGYYHQASNTLRELSSRLTAQSVSEQILGYQKLGHIYRLLGNLKAAHTHLNIAKSFAEKLNAEDPLASQEVAISPILIELGNTAQSRGDTQHALAHYNQAIAQATSPGTELTAQLNRLQLLATNDPNTARQAIAPLSDLIANEQPGRRQIYAYIHAAQSLMTLGSSTDLETAAQWLAQAVQQSQTLQDSHAESYARGYLGHTYELTEQWSEAQTLTESALRTAKITDAADIAYQWEWQLGRLLKQQNQKDAALQSYRAAYRSLQSIRQDLVATNQNLQFSFRDSVEPVYRELVDLLLQSSHSLASSASAASMPDSASALKRQEARNVIESLQVAELDNFFRTACLEGQQVALEAVEETDAAIVYPIILRDRLELLVSLPGQPLQQYTSVVSQSELEQTLTDWRQNLEKPFTTPEGKALGQSLYTWIVQPMESALVEANVNTLTFVLDGALRNAPMAALYNTDHYLIEDYAVALAPGLQLLGPKALQDTSATALLGGLTEGLYGFSELLNVQDELFAVGQLVNSTLLIDEAFTRANLTQQINRSNRPIIHLATHGRFSSDADDTFILAWDGHIFVNELSSILKAGDLNRLEPIELLILSACETASGDDRAALGLAGVAIESGTRSTLASLWNLNDASGAVFIEQFYQALAQPNTTKAKALQRAQLNLLHNQNYEHPTYWSAYVLLGNWL